MPSYLNFLPTILKILVMIGFIFNVAAILTWLDRRMGGAIQDRMGPNRAYLPLFGKKFRLAGLPHLAADGLKFFFKEDFLPPRADKLLFAIAPMLAMVPVLALAAVIPMGDVVIPELVSGRYCRVLPGPLGDFVPPPEVIGKITEMVDGVCRIRQGAVQGEVLNLLSAHNLADLSNPANYVAGLAERAHLIHIIPLAVAPLGVGILYVFAIAGQGIVAAAIAGVSSDNKFSLMGAMRAASQMVSYEVAIGLALVGAMMTYGTVRLDDMVQWQSQNTWGIFVQPLGFVLFFVAATAEMKRIPFDLPEAESELVSGYFTEYSGMKFGMFYFAEYMEIVTSSMLLVTIFLGGWALPFLHRDGLTLQFGAAEPLLVAKLPHLVMILLGVVAFFGKTLALCWFQAVIRWSLPRFRYDQLMKLGWRVLLPASLVNMMVTGIVVLGLAERGAATESVLKLAADVSQALVAVLVTLAFIRLVFGFFSPIQRTSLVVSSAQKLVAARGGVKTLPLQT